MKQTTIQFISRTDRQPVGYVNVVSSMAPPRMMAEAVVEARRWRMNIAGTFLNGADLSGLNLTEQDFSHCDLSGVNFTEADLTRANLSSTEVTGIKLIGTKFHDTIWSNGSVINMRPILIYGLPFDVQILDADMICGCELHSLAEWAAFDDRRVAAMDATKGLRAWKEHKDALLMMARAEGRQF